MASTGIEYLAAATARAGSRLTITSHTITYTGANTVSITATAGTIAYDCFVEGYLDGFLELRFADPTDLRGILDVGYLSDAQILLTEGDTGGVTAIIAERLYTN